MEILSQFEAKIHLNDFLRKVTRTNYLRRKLSSFLVIPSFHINLSRCCSLLSHSCSSDLSEAITISHPRRPLPSKSISRFIKPSSSSWPFDSHRQRHRSVDSAGKSRFFGKNSRISVFLRLVRTFRQGYTFPFWWAIRCNCLRMPHGIR